MSIRGDSNEMFQAYLITCLVTGRDYVGITSRGMRKRWNEHLYSARKRPNAGAVNRAIAKYGHDQFTVSVICEAKSWTDLCAVEKILIDQYQTRAPNGYNLSDGGEGPFGVKRSAEAVERSASKHRGNPCHQNTRRAASEFHKGKPKSPEMRAKLVKARTGTRRSEGTKTKIAAYWAKRRQDGAFKTTEPYAHARKS